MNGARYVLQRVDQRSGTWLIVLLVGVLLFSWQAAVAEAKDTRGCVSVRELFRLHDGMTRKQVVKILDWPGQLYRPNMYVYQHCDQGVVFTEYERKVLVNYYWIVG